MVASTSTELSARSLLKQVAHQAKEALEETEKVRQRCSLFDGLRHGGWRAVDDSDVSLRLVVVGDAPPTRTPPQWVLTADVS